MTALTKNQATAEAVAGILVGLVAATSKTLATEQWTHLRHLNGELARVLDAAAGYDRNSAQAAIQTGLNAATFKKAIAGAAQATGLPAAEVSVVLARKILQLMGDAASRTFRTTDMGRSEDDVLKKVRTATMKSPLYVVSPKLKNEDRISKALGQRLGRPDRASVWAAADSAVEKLSEATEDPPAAEVVGPNYRPARGYAKCGNCAFHWASHCYLRDESSKPDYVCDHGLDLAVAPRAITALRAHKKEQAEAEEAIKAEFLAEAVDIASMSADRIKAARWKRWPTDMKAGKKGNGTRRLMVGGAIARRLGMKEFDVLQIDQMDQAALASLAMSLSG